MNTIVYIGDKPIILKSQDFESEIDIDKLTSIDYSNLYGEFVTASALLNKIGLLKAEAEKKLNEIKMRLDICASTLRQKFRKEANVESGKFQIEGEFIKLTEKSLEDAILLDKNYQTLKSEQIECNKDVEVLDSMFWAIQSKCKKLDNLCKPTTPEEFASEIIEGKINTFFIKK